jgi:deoxyribodipyrimidine photo-lyase
MAKDTFTPQRPEATRAAGEALMQGFIPRMGKRYAQRRNFDNGPGGHEHVSTLSPYLRRRLVLEREVVEAAVMSHGQEGAEKFVQEVVWRGYFKGWMERRPQIWQSYRAGLEQDLAVLDKDRRLARDVARAEARAQSRYLAAHILPTRAEAARFPRRDVILGLFGLFVFLCWGVAVLVIYALRDRR